jgi:hypothetical protein
MEVKIRGEGWDSSRKESDAQPMPPAARAATYWSRKLRNFLDRLRCLGFLNPLRLDLAERSRVTLNPYPTSSSVWSVFMPMPKRMRSTLLARREPGEHPGHRLLEVGLDRARRRIHAQRRRAVAKPHPISTCHVPLPSLGIESTLHRVNRH